MVAIAGAAAVPFGSRKDPSELVRSCTDRVLEDAGVDRDRVDALVVANAAAEALAGIGNVSVWTATCAGLAGLPALRVETGPSSGLAALSVARALVASGRAERVLALGWEVMTRVPTADATRALAQLMSDDERRAGLSLHGMVALMASCYMARTGLTRDELARVPVKAHALASTNPIAHLRKPVTAQDVLTSRVIAPPLRLLDCAPLSDGAAAVLVARDGRVRVAGGGHATDLHALAQRRTPPERFAATQAAARAAFAEARRAPRDVHVVELHDAFSVLEPICMEDLGFAKPGAGMASLGLDEPLASRPAVNPSGGLKARGHPVGATGLAQVVECFDQLTKRAANPVDGARIALAHNVGGFGNNVHVALLEASP